MDLVTLQFPPGFSAQSGFIGVEARDGFDRSDVSVLRDRSIRLILKESWIFGFSWIESFVQ
jgi:hypothetical protein